MASSSRSMLQGTLASRDRQALPWEAWRMSFDEVSSYGTSVVAGRPASNLRADEPSPFTFLCTSRPPNSSSAIMRNLNRYPCRRFGRSPPFASPKGVDHSIVWATHGLPGSGGKPIALTMMWRLKFRYACPASMMRRRISRLRRKRSSSSSPSPHRMARWSLERSSLKRWSMSRTASRLLR